MREIGCQLLSPVWVALGSLKSTAMYGDIASSEVFSPVVLRYCQCGKSMAVGHLSAAVGVVHDDDLVAVQQVHAQLESQSGVRPRPPTMPTGR